MFEYKVRCRHKLGWKEIKLYADTDIEEFFNRNSIDYVRNITDTAEHRQLKEIERLHSIIKDKKERQDIAIRLLHKLFGTDDYEINYIIGIINGQRQIKFDDEILKGE